MQNAEWSRSRSDWARVSVIRVNPVIRGQNCSRSDWGGVRRKKRQKEECRMRRLQPPRFPVAGAVFRASLFSRNLPQFRQQYRPMPIYEFACPKCRVIFNFLSKRSDPGHLPTCPKCGNKNMVKQVSNFATPRRSPEPSTAAEGDAEGEGMPNFD